MNMHKLICVGLILTLGLSGPLPGQTQAQQSPSAPSEGWQGPRPAPQQPPPTSAPQRPYPSGKQVMEVPQIQQSLRPSAPQQMEIPPRVQPESPRPTQLLTVTVTDPQGRYVSDLQPEDFLVYEEDLPQRITYFSTGQEEPVSLGFLVDTSGSMTNKIARARHALRRFFAAIRNGDEVFLEAFSQRPMMLQDFTDSKVLLDQAVTLLEPDGETALYDALLDGLRHVKQGRRQKRALVLLTDGLDTASAASLGETANAIRKSGVIVYTIGIGNPTQSVFRPGIGPFPPPFSRGGRHGGGLGLGIPGLGIPGLGWPGGGLGGMGGPGSGPSDAVDVKVLQAFSTETGGRHFLLNTAEVVGNESVLDQAIQTVSEELRQQYTVGYNSPLKGDVYRNVRVEIRRPGLSARTQKGLG